MLIISNKRIDMETTGIDWSKVNDEKKVERMGLGCDEAGTTDGELIPTSRFVFYRLVRCL